MPLLEPIVSVRLKAQQLIEQREFDAFLTEHDPAQDQGKEDTLRKFRLWQIKRARLEETGNG